MDLRAIRKEVGSRMFQSPRLVSSLGLLLAALALLPCAATALDGDGMRPASLGQRFEHVVPGAASETRALGFSNAAIDDRGGTMGLQALGLGDIDGDNVVGPQDEALLRAVYWSEPGPHGDEPADLNRDGVVDYRDASLMAVCYGCRGDSVSEVGNADSCSDGDVALADILVRPVVDTSILSVGAIFPVEIWVDAGHHAVNALDLHLGFDPDYLRVVALNDPGQLDHVVGSRYDNAAGTIDYGAFAAGDRAFGAFKLCTITMQAVDAVEETYLVSDGFPLISGIHCDTTPARWQNMAFQVRGLGARGIEPFLPFEPPSNVQGPSSSVGSAGAQGLTCLIPLVLWRPWLTAPAPLSTWDRFGVAVCGALPPAHDYPLDDLPFGWFSDWSFRIEPNSPNGAEYVQLVPVREGPYPPDWEELREAVLHNKGSLWIIGNEPECVHQGSRTPQEYADIYHEYHAFISELDPKARFAIGGVVEPTPLRLEWLDLALGAYETSYGEPMPIDVWNTHNQLLREKRDEHGCEIPVGLAADSGKDYPWWENDNIGYFSDHIWAMRRWMADRGYRDKPLILTEYGILYPSHWYDALGGPSGDQRVQDFMSATFDFLLNARDDEIGNPLDDNRLVQRWMWFSLNSLTWSQDPASGFNGNLCDAYTHDLTVFGQHYSDVVNRYISQQP